MLPNFMIIGAPKCGTTWLSTALRQHPEVFMAREKEIHFFDHPENFARGKDWYEQHFTGAAHAAAIGEATPTYLSGSIYQPGIVTAIRDMVPACRLIIMLRDPVARALSALRHQIRMGRLSPNMDMDHELRTRLEARSGVVEFGNYSKAVALFLESFPRSQFHFVTYERGVVTSSQDTLAGVCRFLGISDSFGFADLERVRNRSIVSRAAFYASRVRPRFIGSTLARLLDSSGLSQPVVASASTRALLAEYYEPEVDRLSNLIGLDLQIWRDGWAGAPAARTSG